MARFHPCLYRTCHVRTHVHTFITISRNAYINRFDPAMLIFSRVGWEEERVQFPPRGLTSFVHTTHLYHNIQLTFHELIRTAEAALISLSGKWRDLLCTFSSSSPRILVHRSVDLWPTSPQHVGQDPAYQLILEQVAVVAQSLDLRILPCPGYLQSAQNK